MSKRIIAFTLMLALVLSCMPVMVFAQSNTSAVLTVDDVYATPGSSVTVDIELENNPGILGATLSVSWDDGLTLTGHESGEVFSELSYQGPSRLVSGCNFIWYGDAVSNIIDGTILTLTFNVTEAASDAEIFDIEVTYDSADILDQSYNPVELTVNNGSVRIVTYKPGDVTDDDRINTLDLIKLSQYISDGKKTDPDGFNVTINESAADVNDDGRMNTLDLIWISQYISDGCKTDPEGYNITLKPSTPKCAHSMQAIAAKAATCTEDGNDAYWYCTKCEKYFSTEAGTAEINLEDTVIEASHSLTAVEEKNPSYTEDGNIAYWYCSACEKYFTDAEASEEITYEQTVIPKLQATEHLVEYDVANGDPYLQKLVDNGTLKNLNPSSYAEGIGLTLTNLSVAGYRFLGWYDLAENGTLVKKIDATATETYQLYAYWSKIEYTVQYKSSLFVDRAQDTYTVDTGLVLPTPKLSNYSFVGWSDESGKLLKGTAIPVGTTGNLILDGNWTSERNKTWTKPVLDAPIIETDEENGVILFAYEIGEIQNVPLYTIKDFGYIAGEGITKTESTTYRVTITEEMMKAYAKSVAKATTESSNWTLASTWNETTSVNEEWCQENGKNVEEVNEIAKSDSQNWNISNSKSGSTETVSTTTNQDGWKNEVKVNSSSSSTDTESSTDKTTKDQAWNVDAKLTYTPKSYSFGIDVFEVGGANASVSGGWGGEIGGGYEHNWGEEHVDTEEHSDTTSSGMEMGGSHDKSTLTTNGTTSTSSWNNTTSYGGSSTNSSTHTNSTALSEKISQAYGYGSSYATGGEAGSSQGLSSSQSDSESYSSSVTYGTETSEEVTSQWTTQSTKAGYHRWVVAGTAHVFAVVGYDMTKNSYFVYTYSVMDDETHEFEDYSYTSADYNDQENGVISFEIPFEVAEYVQEKTSYSDGLKVNQVTGIIEEYTGDDTCVVIPEYWNVGNGDVVKVTGIAKDAFAGNENICAVVLSDFITEIPDYAFQNCTSLKEISGGNITRIGSYAFAGCVNVEDIGVRSSVEHLGEKAFDGVQRIIVNAADKNVLKAAVESGAEQIIVSLEYLKNGEQELNGVELTVPSGTKFFELNGNYKTYEDFTLNSEADITILNKINFAGKTQIPLKISSEDVVLNQCTITASGIALVLSADVTHLGLQSDVTVQSSNENTMLVKGLSLYEINKNVVGRLIVKDKLLQCGTTEGSSHLSYTEYQEINLGTFENLLDSFTLYFDANCGSCSEESRSVPNSTKLGALPVATREHYIFGGWFLADGTEVTEDSVFSTGADVYVYAKWTTVPYTASWNTGTGYTITVKRTSSPNANATIGNLKSGDTVYYGDVLSITYTASTGYSLGNKGKTSITVTGNVTSSDIYTSATVNSYKVSWNTGTGYTIAVKRTSSPLKGASTGALNNGATIYYGDVLSVTYTASTGYSLGSKGSTSITVTGNVTKDHIYTSASLNSYTYNIVYKSSNGTALGSTTATYKYGTTNTISAPAKSGYTTPSSQSVKWDSTSAKTITFTYAPIPATNSTKSGSLCSSPVVTYSAKIEYQNRTATSVQVRVVWTSTIAAYNYNSYGQKYTATIGSTSKTATINSYGTWKDSSSSARSSTGTTDWITVSLSTTNATTVSLGINYWQVNSNGTNMTQHYGAYGYSTTWTVNIPAY